MPHFLLGREVGKEEHRVSSLQPLDVSVYSLFLAWRPCNGYLSVGMKNKEVYVLI